ncbi:MAG: DUF3833 domain-containing protein [Polynucleobacter sp.]|jgi:hypothetical protein|nr:DUF3833 domain-containing protein [Polynucleobacter sp.]MDZ4055901.1 DUF3833 domain-containing protein [Polynucleobacter sp.]
MRFPLRIASFFLASALILVGCSSPQVDRYASEKPALDLTTYFNGTIDAYGIFTNRSNEVVKRFKVVMKASWVVKDGKRVGTLDEDFFYSDGTTQKRIWTLTETAPGVFTGTADDVIGSAAGMVAGNALNWKYTLALPVDGTVYHVQFDDWMYLMDDKVMINKAQMSKFGIYLGEVTLAFYKR